MIEVLPDLSNRVSVDPGYSDRLGNLRPVISSGLPDYTLGASPTRVSSPRRIFQRLGADDHTLYEPTDYGWINYQGEGYVIRGGNHLAGTHIMGTSPRNSVVDAQQRSWDHENLYLVGAGSMPTVGTSNTTLTIAALSFRTRRTHRAELASAAARASSTRLTTGSASMSLNSITNVDELRRHLQAAMQLEHATIPPYLTALYSIQPGTNSRCVSRPARRGGRGDAAPHSGGQHPERGRRHARPDAPGFVPDYPAYLPDGETDFKCRLSPFSRECARDIPEDRAARQAPDARTG